MALKTGLFAVLCLSLFFGSRIALAAPDTAPVESTGVSDLRRALQQLRGTQAIALDVQFKLFGRSGDDKDLQEREGLLQLRLEDSAEGLRMFYPPH